MTNLSGVVAKLSVHLGLETAAFEKGTKRATKEMSGFEKNMTRVSGAVKTAFVGMLGAFAVDQLVTAAKDALDYAGSLGEVAKQLGVSTDALQSFRYIATQVGVEQDEMDKGLAKLTRTIGEAVKGSGKAADLFDRLGISVRDSTGQVKSAEAILPEIANAYNRLGSEAEKSALSAEVFGAKLGQKLNPALELGADGIANMVREANELGLVLSKEMIDNADTASDTLTTLSNVMKLQFTAAVAANAKEVAYLASQLGELLNTLGKVTRAYRGFANIRETEGIWEALTTDFSELGNYATREDYVTSYYGKKPLKFKPDTSMPKPDPRYSGVGVSRKTPFSIAPKTPWPTTKAMGASAFGGLDMSQFTPGQGEGFIRIADDVKQMAGPLQNVLSLTDRINISVGAQMARNFQEAASGALDLAGAAQSIMDRLFPEDARRRKYIDELAKLRLEYGGTAAMAEQLAEAERRLRQEWILSLPNVESLRAGFGKYMQMAKDAADVSEVQSVRIARTFQDMADDVLGSLNNLSSSIKGGGFLDILSSVIGVGLQLGGTGLFGKNIAASINRIPAYANGTNFARGGLSLVGERGPELVDLPRGSRVTPNNELGGLGGIAQIVPSPYFDVVVDGRVMRAAPSIANAGASGAVTRLQRNGSRRIA